MMVSVGCVQPCTPKAEEAIMDWVRRICLNPDGTELELGEGNFGRVVKGIRNEVQEVAA